MKTRRNTLTISLPIERDDERIIVEVVLYYSPGQPWGLEQEPLPESLEIDEVMDSIELTKREEDEAIGMGWAKLKDDEDDCE